MSFQIFISNRESGLWHPSLTLRPPSGFGQQAGIWLRAFGTTPKFPLPRGTSDMPKTLGETLSKEWRL